MGKILCIFICSSTALFGAAEKSTTGVLKKVETEWGILSIEGAFDATGYGCAIQSWSSKQGRNTTGAIAVIAAGKAANLLVPSIAMLLPMFLDNHNAATSLVKTTDELNRQFTSPLVASSVATDRLCALGILLTYGGDIYKGVANNINGEANVVPYIAIKKSVSHVSTATQKVAFAQKRDDPNFPNAPVILWRPKK